MWNKQQKVMSGPISSALPQGFQPPGIAAPEVVVKGGGGQSGILVNTFMNNLFENTTYTPSNKLKKF